MEGFTGINPPELLLDGFFTLDLEDSFIPYKTELSQSVKPQGYILTQINFISWVHTLKWQTKSENQYLPC
jgi:hypothetical protein